MNVMITVNECNDIIRYMPVDRLEQVECTDHQQVAPVTLPDKVNQTEMQKTKPAYEKLLV